MENISQKHLDVVKNEFEKSSERWTDLILQRHFWYEDLRVRIIDRQIQLILYISSVEIAIIGIVFPLLEEENGLFFSVITMSLSAFIGFCLILWTISHDLKVIPKKEENETSIFSKLRDESLSIRDKAIFEKVNDKDIKKYFFNAQKIKKEFKDSDDNFTRKIVDFFYIFFLIFCLLGFINFLFVVFLNPILKFKNMENLTSLTSMNNLAVQTIFNFNFNVFVNLFIYSAGVAFGVLTAIKIIEGIVSFVHYKWTSSFKRRAEEIKELNRKMHDRLVEIEEAVESNIIPKNYAKIKTRIRYNASRLKKYNKTIFDNVECLLGIISANEKNGVVVADDKESIQIKNLSEQIREKVDKLWL